jgi:hypothetical protein
MKFEFRPDFKARFAPKALRPKFMALFVRLKFNPENSRRMMKKVLPVLSLLLMAVVIAIIAARIL